MQEKSANFNSLRPILFELCKKKTTGGPNRPPLPAGIGLNLVNWFTFKWFMHFDMLFLLVYNDGLYSKTALSSTGGAVSGNQFDQFTAPAAASWAGAGG